MNEKHSSYYDRTEIARKVSAGEHRALIGGLWDEIGELQFEYLRANGLVPQSRLLDIGCGSLRLGIKAVEYLETGNYWGTDINESLIGAGYEKEIVPAGLGHKLPRANLVQDDDFGFAGIPRSMDFVIAQSVFTHLPLNHLRLCLANLAEHVEGQCIFFLTMFIAPDEALFKPFRQQPGNVVTHPHRDPYHYSLADLKFAAEGLPWSAKYLGDWNHPRNQKMIMLSKS